MDKPVLTKDIAYKALQSFFDDKPFILFATGTSCAVDLDFGMGALEAELKDKIPNCSDLTPQQQEEWQRVVEVLQANHDFEAAMNAVQDELLLKAIIDKTANHVARIDHKNSLDILNGTKIWSAIGIIQRLVERLPETDRTLHVATPNYDLLAEYAFSRAEIPYSTGFWGGFIRKLDWIQAERQMTYAEKISTGRKTQSVTRIRKHIRLYKVHGSLNTFLINNECVESDAWVWDRSKYERVMITPGMSKYQRLHDNRDTLLSEYDKAVRNHNAFLFLGFGFNDSHLVYNAIGDKLRNQAAPALIITRDLNDRIQDLLNNSDSAWLVCKHQDDDTTKIFNRKYSNWLYLQDKALWRFDMFATEIMGN